MYRVQLTKIADVGVILMEGVRIYVTGGAGYSEDGVFVVMFVWLVKRMSFTFSSSSL